MSTFKLPDLGEGLSEAEIVNWHVSVGDDVVADQPLVSVETDKAVVDIPSPQSGRVTRIHGKAGDVLKVGAPLIEFEQGARRDTGVIVGETPRSDAKLDEGAAAEAPGRTRVKATPAVRALARKLNVDLAAVDASGPEGTVTAADVERVAKSLAGMAPPEPIRGVRRAMAQKMAQSHAEVAPATVYDEADVNEWAAGSDPTVRLIRAMAAACKSEPALNAWYDSQSNTRRLHPKLDLGIAVHTDSGLFVPVMRDVGNRSADDLRRGIEAMKADVAKRAIPPEEMRGATLTLSNFGVFGGGRFAQLVIIPPQVGIVGAGRAKPRAEVRDGKVVPRRMLPLSLTFDHRVVNGGEAAGFLAALIKDLEKPD
jgi:pyruvate dehydrogenase E2 component (dihydrolipoamide acetyltransferase)